MRGQSIDPAPAVDLLDEEPLEIELATTLLYEHSRHPYRQLREAVAGLSQKRREEIIELGMRHRGGHDELLRAYCAGQKFRFDILMDIGAYRDLHRHRRCVQIHQEYCFEHGFDTPREILEAGHAALYADGHAARRRRRAETLRRARRARRSQPARAIPASSGLSQAHAFQDGFCRGGLHQRTAHRSRAATGAIAASPTRCTNALPNAIPRWPSTSG